MVTRHVHVLGRQCGEAAQTEDGRESRCAQCNVRGQHH
jgi:hypothetical protein